MWSYLLRPGEQRHPAIWPCATRFAAVALYAKRHRGNERLRVSCGADCLIYDAEPSSWPCYVGRPWAARVRDVCGLPVGDGANPSMRCRSRAGAEDLGGERHLKWAKLPGSARPRLPTRRSFDSPAHTGLGARIGARLRLLSLKDAAGRATRSNRGLPGVRHRAEGPPCPQGGGPPRSRSKEPILPLGSLLFQGKLKTGRSAALASDVL